MIIFTYTNPRVSMENCPSFFLDVVDRECSYQTQLGNLIESGFVPPELNNNWDGVIRMLHRPKTIPPWVPAGLLGKLIHLAKKFDLPYQVIDQRRKPESDIPDGKPIELRSYQQEAVNAAVQIGRGVIDASPRAGKTRCMLEIIRQLALPTIMIAPTDRIVKQTKLVSDALLGPHYATQITGSKNSEQAKNIRLVICTAATASLLPEEFYKSREVLIWDEAHHLGTSQSRAIYNMCDHIYYRYGCTGTFFRSDSTTIEMLALAGDVIYKIGSKQLLDLGYLVPIHVAMLPTLGPRLRGVGHGFQGGHGTYGIHKHSLRNSMVASITQMLHDSGRTVLVLVGTKQHGRALQDIVSDLIPRSPNSVYKSVEFVNHDTDRKILEEILESFTSKGVVKVVIATTILKEGVDLPAADALCYARGEHAEVSLVQAAYRVATAIKGKKDALIIDFIDRHNKKLLDHSKDRLTVYSKEPTFDVSIMTNMDEVKNFIIKYSPK